MSDHGMMRAGVGRWGLGDRPAKVIRLRYGYLEYMLTPWWTAEVVYIEVDEHHYKEGIGRQLLEKLYAEIQGKVHSVYLFAHTLNPTALAFWRKTGWTEHATVPGFYPDGDGVLFTRRLGDVTERQEKPEWRGE